MGYVDARCLYNLGNGVARVVKHVLIPLHRRTRGQQRSKSFDGFKPFNAIDYCTVDTRNSAQLGLNVAITWGLSTPRTTIYIGFAIDDANNGVIVVHQVAIGNIAQPKTYVRAFTCSTFSSESITTVLVSNKRGMNKQSLFKRSCKTVS